jgi:hypothetical protein
VVPLMYAVFPTTLKQSTEPIMSRSTPWATVC